ncbi:MAG: hypothetical protein ACJAV2_001406, partial [Myxococcota bacterium]
MVRTVPVVSGSGSKGRSLRRGDEIVLHVPVRGYLRYLPA